ncbi:thiamine phosphate synthase [Texcoconibacillus texcoconensis]|uniref:Thiamine-phosphate synthase n=1 Tax=Texcoconibacillus texcoconensis TaxID=1095777 RepID=A0A840QQB1_9BACI|nr:thiamine-phosphate pyrophosphorylase [Texcoconibacillus texcoconensis]
MARWNEEEIRRVLSLYFIAGSVNVTRPLDNVLHEVINGGATIFQFREKGEGALKTDQKEQLARRLQKLCRGVGIPFIVNDDVELAVKLNADGLHVGQDDAATEQARQAIGDGLLGVSAHTVNEAKEAVQAGADYLGVGPMYPTTSKDDAESVRGPEFIRTLREAGILVPIVGIGGINISNANDVIKAGADGVSVISALAAEDEPQSVAEQFLKQIKAQS